MALNEIRTLDPQLQIVAYEQMVRMESVPMDVFDLRSGLYSVSEDPQPIPDAIYLKLTAGANSARSVRVPLMKALAQAPTLGSTTQQLSREERILMRFFQASYNDMSHAVAGQEYGILARDYMPYKVFEKIAPLLGTYFREYMGVMRRQGLLEVQSENLLEDPHNFPQAFSPNWFMPGLNNNQQPVYQVNFQNWVNAIATGLDTAGTGVGAACSVEYFQRLQEWASNWIEPIDLGGKSGYIVLLPSPQATWFLNSTNVGSLGPVWRDAAAVPEKEKMWYPGLIGDMDMLRFIVDQRYPTLSPGGTGDNRTLTARYRRMGQQGVISDPRDMTLNGRQCGFLIGRAGLVEWKPEDFHYEYHMDNYGKIYGKGLFASAGVMQPRYDTSVNPTAATMQQDSSIVLPFAQPPGWASRPIIS